VQGQLEGVAEEMADYRDERSETWQNSERCERFTERLEPLEEFIECCVIYPKRNVTLGAKKTQCQKGGNNHHPGEMESNPPIPIFYPRNEKK